MSFCPPNMDPFPFIFDPDNFDKKITILPTAPDDIFSTLHQNFSKILTDTNLEAFANTSDFGIAEFNKIPPKSFMPTFFDDQPNPLDIESMSGSTFKGNSRIPRGFPPNFGYSPLGFSQNDMNPATTSLMNGAGKASFCKQLGFGGMPQMDYTPPRMMTKFEEDAYPQFEAMNNLTMKDFPPMHDYEAFAEEPLGLAWNNNASSLKEFKSTRTQVGHLFGVNQDNIPMETGFMPLVGSNSESTGQSYTKAEAISSGQSGASQGNVMKKGETGNRKKSPPVKAAYDIQGKKIEGEMKTKEIGSLQRKSSKFSDEDDDKDDFENDPKGRSSKGLRVLSLKVKDIVIEKKKTTYKEVAATLIRELGGQLKTKSQGETKDEQNVKRRVYDALNVLIATGVLQKEGKMVSCYEHSGSAIPVHAKKDIRDKKEQMQHKILQTKNIKKEKLESLHELLYKTLALKNLIKRNKEIAEEELGVKKINKNSAHDGTEGTIKFPFLVIASSTGESSMNLNMETSQKELVVESKHALNVSGDVDVLLKMGLQYVSRGFYNQNIPQGLEKHIPKSFMDKLL